MPIPSWIALTNPSTTSEATEMVPSEYKGTRGTDQLSGQGRPPPADMKAAEHRRRTRQDDYDEEIWAYGYAPARFREYGLDGRLQHRRREIHGRQTLTR